MPPKFERGQRVWWIGELTGKLHKGVIVQRNPPLDGERAYIVREGHNEILIAESVLRAVDESEGNGNG